MTAVAVGVLILCDLLFLSRAHRPKCRSSFTVGVDLIAAHPLADTISLNSQLQLQLTAAARQLLSRITSQTDDINTHSTEQREANKKQTVSPTRLRRSSAPPLHTKQAIARPPALRLSAQI